jgi:type II secretory pathway pseudopilin PulG
MMLSKTTSGAHGEAAFSLIEMVAVIAILVTLMTAGVSLLKDTGAQSRRTGTDLLTGIIEQARTAAITSRSDVVLAIAEPSEFPAGDERCRIGLFKVKEWPNVASGSALTLTPENCVLMSRWQTLNTGIVLLGGDVQIGGSDENIKNAVSEQPDVPIAYKGGNRTFSFKVHAIAFNSRGGLRYPVGSNPIVLRVAEGSYRNKKPTANLRKGQEKPTESILKIGRVTARPYRIDG